MDLAPRWRRYWPEADVARLASDAAGRLRGAIDRWGLRDALVLPGGNVALTCAAVRGSRSVVVKVNPRDHVEDGLMRSEGEALGFWNSSGASVALLDSADDGFTLLLERLEPGTTLDDAGASYEDVLVRAGGLARRLHAAGPAPAAISPMEAYTQPLRDALRGQPGLCSEFDALQATAETTAALHADLHGGNILRHGESWKAIDPRGIRGDPHLEIWTLVCPQAPPLPADSATARREARERVAIYASAARLDAERVRAWARVVAAAESILSAGSEHPGWIGRLRRLAAALA